ncbi:MAG: hypothetical protein HC884_19715 [Chloroflexaceae bacterium]|nr:hypothetical protein [Chloroflexaceae bacterium]
MTLETILQQAEQLSADEQLQLLVRLAERLRWHYAPAAPQPPAWDALCGLASYPFLGEDAQVWVSRSRQESEHRGGQA